MRSWTVALLLAALGAGCGGGDETKGAPAPDTRTHALFDVDHDLAEDGRFYDFPYPSDLRLTKDGTPDLRGVPHPSSVSFFDGWAAIAGQRTGFATVPVAYFRFSAPLAPIDAEALIAADASSPILLVDVDPKSPERGALVPAVATTLEVDDYAPENLLAVAPRPGFVLHERRTYAVVVRTAVKDANGDALAPSAELASMRAGKPLSGARGADASAVYQPLWDTLAKIGVDAGDVASATVFTTGDVVADMHDLSEKVLASHSITIDDLHVDPDDGASHDRFCELVGKVTYPQFQKGKPPFDTDGLFEIGADGAPVKQRDEDAPITILIPKGEMPAGGFPLMIYFHGSGGVSGAVVDRGRWTPDTMMNTKGEGPGYVVAPFGIASAGSALPVNPERLPGASEQEYLNFNNVPAMRDTFRQGVIEQRLFLEALRKVKIDPATLGACTGSTLPQGETAFHFADDRLVASGQSMGGMYTNMISAVEPRIRAAVPTGAGGYWTWYVLQTTVIPNAKGLLGVILATHSSLTFMHPALSVLETGLEPADPFVYMPRLAKRPLPGAPVRPIYEPVGKGDSYFPTPIYDAVAASYGHKQAGDAIWPEMQDVLALEGLGGMLPYPVKDDVKSEDGTAYTGVVVQYEGDGVYDPHAIYSQLDAVKYQYGCFLSTFLATGKATVPAPAPLGTPCSE
jgi:hypothetical protein